MHFSSYLKAELFVEEYLAGPGTKPAVLEIGSKSYHGQDTYKDLFPADGFDYTGLDIEAGPNVDIVPENMFVWNEIAGNTFDVCISGQTFEHNPFFWITFAEIARVLKPGGLAFIVAPGAGAVHRYPLDCWRFYPDSWSALCSLTGLELVESYIEPDEHLLRMLNTMWRDSAVIARKPVLEPRQQKAFDARLEKVVCAFRDPVEFSLDPPRHGKWVAKYNATIRATKRIRLKLFIRKLFAGQFVRLNTE